MKVGIPISKNAYTPESYAYKEYFESLGYDIELDYKLDPNNDINLIFMGVKPFWKKTKGRAKEIHEYQSLSTYPFPKFKNLTKRFINEKPEGRIFLNSVVKEEFNFRDSRPYIFRDMGVDKSLFQKPDENPCYDIIYCGSISSRNGLIEVLLNLAKCYKIVVIGKTSELEKKKLNVKNITLLGTLLRADLPDIYRNARYGLNYTPNIYPYNIQTSTKTLEYLASGLHVISNRYPWAEKFFNRIDYQPVWLDDNAKNQNIILNDISVPNIPLIENYSWDKILINSKVDRFLRELLENEAI